MIGARYFSFHKKVLAELINVAIIVVFFTFKALTKLIHAIVFNNVKFIRPFLNVINAVITQLD